MARASTSTRSNAACTRFATSTVPEPKASFVTAFKGKNCGVPVLTGQYWIQTVPAAHAVVALDITNPERPREVSTLAVGEDEGPHWISIDSTGRRIVLNSSGSGTGNRLFIIDFDPAMDDSRSTSGFATRAPHGPASD